MELAVISDSHIPAREPAIPDAFCERIAAADHTIHAGDFETADVLADVRELATELTAVHGNIDPDIGLPAVASVTLGGVTFVVTHGTINPVQTAANARQISTTGGGATIRGDVLAGANWETAIADTARVRTRAWNGEGIVGIGGHSHEVVDTVHEGVRLLNPGSVTGADPADIATMLTVEVEDGAVDVTLHER
ncbi:MAG: metallophosphoesterase family protein [Halolamina sp.]|uniref:metallophosphoesterase family protein n=1 Tax=Halolamina sp. TaxID=1940283 RepID=UPI002FC2EEDB